MKCPTCGAWTEVEATRQADRGHTVRRTRACANGHRFTSFEVLPRIYRRSPAEVRKTVVSAEVRAVMYRRNLAVVQALKTSRLAQVAAAFDLELSAVRSIKRRFKP